MIRATEEERRRLNATFAELCAIRSVSGEERAVADHVSGLLRAAGLEVDEDDTAAATGLGCGNLLARIPGAAERSVLLCAHLDTVPHDGVVEPVCDDGGWTSAGETILGADNKAAVAVLLEIARRYGAGGAPVGIELLLTPGEEIGLIGAEAFDATRLRSSFGYVLDHATPVGEIVVASPTFYRVEATFRGKAAHAGLRPEEGRSAIVAAARAIAAMPHGRLDPETTVNVGGILGGTGTGATNVVAARCDVVAEARSVDPRKADDAVAAIVDACQEAANDPGCCCDLDIRAERLFTGYRHAAAAPAVLAAEAALSACGYTPRRIVTGGGSDANALEAQGFPCTNLANGTERNHEPTERVSTAALEGMLDVMLTLIDQLGSGAAPETAS